ncbi:O-antigen ligase family protein [Cellulophaga baltica]|uniref:O-antigen ligase family protein n=1 Tax=Cellulophaga baltica TaxID=76594 RepID=UPI0037C5673C
METSQNKNYQSFILFFAWTASVMSIISRLYSGIDLVVIALFTVLLDIAINFKQIKVEIRFDFYKYLSLVLIFYGWILFTNAYSVSPTYKFEKSLTFIANVIFFIYPFFIKKINFNHIIKYYTFLIVPVTIYFIYMKSIIWSVDSEATEMFMTIRNTYLVFGIHMGIYFLLLIYFKKNIFLKILAFFLLLACSARGALIFTIITTFIYFLINNKIRKFKANLIFKFAALIITCFSIYFLFSSKIDSLLTSSISRFDSLLGGEDGSSLERVHRLEFAITQPFEKLSTFLIGNGMGSFGILYEQVDKRSYPHNIFVECLFEYGLIGLILFISFFLVLFKNFSLKKDIFHLLFLFVFFNALKSSSITDLWLLYGFAGGMVSLNYKQTENI